MKKIGLKIDGADKKICVWENTGKFSETKEYNKK